MTTNHHIAEAERLLDVAALHRQEGELKTARDRERAAQSRATLALVEAIDRLAELVPAAVTAAAPLASAVAEAIDRIGARLPEPIISAEIVEDDETPDVAALLAPLAELFGGGSIGSDPAAFVETTVAELRRLYTTHDELRGEVRRAREELSAERDRNRAAWSRLADGAVPDWVHSEALARIWHEANLASLGAGTSWGRMSYGWRDRMVRVATAVRERLGIAVPDDEVPVAIRPGTAAAVRRVLDVAEQAITEHGDTVRATDVIASVRTALLRDDELIVEDDDAAEGATTTMTDVVASTRAAELLGIAREVLYGPHADTHTLDAIGLAACVEAVLDPRGAVAPRADTTTKEQITHA